MRRTIMFWEPRQQTFTPTWTAELNRREAMYQVVKDVFLFHVNGGGSSRRIRYWEVRQILNYMMQSPDPMDERDRAYQVLEPFKTWTVWRIRCRVRKTGR